MTAPADTNPVTVILVHWRRPEECLETLAAFRGQTAAVRFILVDNGSPPDQVDALRAAAPDARFITLPENVGFGPGMNAGLRDWLADPDGGEFVVLAPHDARPAPDCVEKVLGELRRRPEAGIACAEYGEPTKPGYDWLRGPMSVPAGRGKRAEAWEPVAFPNGTLMAFRRACLQQVGLFDERYYAYTEEYDIARRARRAGWGVGVVWGAVVGNPIRAASSKVTWYLLIRNQLLAVRDTHGRARAAALSAHLLAAGAARRLLAPGRQNEGDRAGVRWRAVRDFWRGRFGPPPDFTGVK